MVLNPALVVSPASILTIFAWHRPIIWPLWLGCVFWQGCFKNQELLAASVWPAASWNVLITAAIIQQESDLHLNDSMCNCNRSSENYWIWSSVTGSKLSLKEWFLLFFGNTWPLQSSPEHFSEIWGLLGGKYYLAARRDEERMPTPARRRKTFRTDAANFLPVKNVKANKDQKEAGM